VSLFTNLGLRTVFENLEGFPADWQTNAPAFIKFVREHQCPSFLEYGEYPYVSADEIKKALKLKAAFSNIVPQRRGRVGLAFGDSREGSFRCGHARLRRAGQPLGYSSVYMERTARARCRRCSVRCAVAWPAGNISGTISPRFDAARRSNRTKRVGLRHRIIIVIAALAGESRQCARVRQRITLQTC
jgi:hypothetical protein